MYIYSPAEPRDPPCWLSVHPSDCTKLCRSWRYRPCRICRRGRTGSFASRHKLYTVSQCTPFADRCIPVHLSSRSAKWLPVSISMDPIFAFHGSPPDSHSMSTSGSARDVHWRDGCWRISFIVIPSTTGSPFPSFDRTGARFGRSSVEDGGTGSGTDPGAAGSSR